MALGEKTKRIYLSVGFGTLRQKADKDNPKATERTLQSGEKTYAIEYMYVSGILDNIVFKDDPKYGKQWTVFVDDGEEHYAIRIKEDSRYASDLLKRVPNMYKGEHYRFTPYDFETNGKRRVGLSIKNQADERIESYYQKFHDEGEGKFRVENLHGYPAFEGDAKDKEELKIYFIQVAKFLRTEALKHLEGDFGIHVPTEINEPEIPDEIPIGEEDDLPF